MAVGGFAMLGHGFGDYGVDCVCGGRGGGHVCEWVTRRPRWVGFMARMDCCAVDGAGEDSEGDEFGHHRGGVLA